MLKIKNCLVRLTTPNVINIYGTWCHIINRKQINIAATLSSEWVQARPFNEIPTQSHLQLMLNYLPGGKYYKKDATALMRALYREHGNLFYMPSLFGQTPKLITFNPNDFECVLRNEGIWPERPGSEVLGYHREKYRADFFQGVEGIISTQGEKWGTFRSAVNPVLMQTKNVKLYLQKMVQVNLEFVDKIKKLRDPQTLEVPANFEEVINRWMLELVSVVALDKQLGLLSDNETNIETLKFFQSLTDFFTYSYKLDFEPSLWRFYATGNFKRLMNALDNIKQFSVHFVNEAMTRLVEERKLGIERAEHEQSVLEKLLKIDEKIAVIMAMDILMSGVDTTSSAFTGFMLCLAKNPEKQQKLRDEIMRLLPNKDSELCDQAFNNLPYMRACIKESLRLYPTTVANIRVVQNNVVLSGFRVPKGTEVILVYVPLLRDEKFFSRANEFLPERWLRAAAAQCPNESAALKANNAFIFLPFGFGPRSCIGQRLVEMQMKLGAALLIRHFRLEFNHSTEHAFKTLLINVPNIPLKFKFTDMDK